MNYIVNFVFWFKNYLFRPYAIKQYRCALRNYKLNSTRLEELNWEKRKLLVFYAYQNIPFYHDFYEMNRFHPSMLHTEKDWEKVPVLEKNMVRENIDRMKASCISKRHIGTTSTGGSTGIPLKIYVDKRFHWEIVGWRMFKQWAISPGDNVGIIHRRVPISFIGKLKNRLLWWPTKRIYLNASSIDDDDVQHFVDDIIRKKIVWLQGYVGGLERVADYILANQITIKTLKMVWATSAPLLANVRLKMESAFRCKIMNQYGCCEVPNIAMQCCKGEHLHINNDVVHIDILNSEGHIVMDEEGDILVTNLESRAFPLIKYRLGDRGTILSQHCICGSPFPLLKQIKGRISDAIYTPSGVYIDGCYLTTLFDKYSTLFNQFQIFQHKDYSVTIYVKTYKNDELTRNALDYVKNRLSTDTKNEIPINISIVKHIEDDRGKIRYILSEIALSKYNRP